jgi:hypothetical protein
MIHNFNKQKNRACGVCMALLGFDLNARVIHRIHTRFSSATQPHPQRSTTVVEE